MCVTKSWHEYSINCHITKEATGPLDVAVARCFRRNGKWNSLYSCTKQFEVSLHRASGSNFDVLMAIQIEFQRDLRYTMTLKKKRPIIDFQQLAIPTL